MRRAALCTVVTALLVQGGCRKAAEESKQQSFQPPSASELFELESKCDGLGEKVLDNNVIGSALTQSQVSHYNPKDNRCYVLLSVSTADLRTPDEQFTTDYFLDDGQTGENLATRYCKGRTCTAMIYDESLKKMVKDPVLPSESEVRDLMDDFVHTNRQSPSEKTAQ